MKTRILISIAALLLVTCMSVPAMAADVAHGKCVNYDKDKKLIVIDEYDLRVSKEDKYGKPTGKQLTFDTSEALIGITPVPGDILRIAYREKDGKLTAIRMMNVSKQDIMKK